MKWCGINALLCAMFALRLGEYLVSLVVALSPDHVIYGQYLEVSAVYHHDSWTVEPWHLYLMYCYRDEKVRNESIDEI